MNLNTNSLVFCLFLATLNFAFIHADDTETKKFSITFKCSEDKVFFEPIEYFNAVFGEQESSADDLLPENWNPCICTEIMDDLAVAQWGCECCAGIKYGDDFYEEFKIYTYYKFNPFYLTFALLHHTTSIAEFQLSAYNPPPICIPILLPIPALPCFIVYGVQYNDDNIYFCMSLEATVFMVAKRYEYSIGCIRASEKGLEFFELRN